VADQNRGLNFEAHQFSAFLCDIIVLTQLAVAPFESRQTDPFRTRATARRHNRRCCFLPSPADPSQRDFPRPPNRLLAHLSTAASITDRSAALAAERPTSTIANIWTATSLETQAMRMPIREKNGRREAGDAAPHRERRGPRQVPPSGIGSQRAMGC
jgi:hypothetical protein